MTGPAVSPYLPAKLVVEIVHAGRRETRVFDAGEDRRVIVGRGPSCDLQIESPLLSRKHAMLLCTGLGWQLHDLGSTNGVDLNGVRIAGPRTLAPGDVFGVGELQIRYVGGEVPSGFAATARVIVDLGNGAAMFGGEPLPLSAAELIWFGWLAVNRSRGDGWVAAGADGHAALGRFAAALLARPWARAVKTAPLLELARGSEVDDEDLKNLRGKTTQKLRAFCAGPRAWLATIIVPEVSGKNRQRIPLPPGSLQVIDPP
jgi:FHA domain-containing protein